MGASSEEGAGPEEDNEMEVDWDDDEKDSWVVNWPSD